MLKNAAAFASDRFGWGRASHAHEVDLTCWLPKAVYVLCMMAM